jgi:hypothetical protein
LLATVLFGIAACGSPKTPTSQPDLAVIAGPVLDLSSASIDLSGSTPFDLASQPGSDLACAPPAGNDCPSTSGNCLGIGKPCTKGGGECMAQGLSCDKDQSDSGVGICIKLGGCTHGMHQCGAGATCCATQDTFFFPVCVPNQCLPDGCTAE